MSSRTVDVDTQASSASNDNTEIMPATIITAAPNASPFLLKVQDIEVLTQSDGFSILRAHLAEHYKYE